MENEIIGTENNKHYCAICGGEMEIEYDSYCLSCRKKYNQNYYKNHSQSQYIYMFINKESEVLYLGSTIDPYRLQKHISGKSNLNLDMTQWNELGLNKIQYADVTALVTSKEERLYLENLFIEKSKPLLNRNEVSTDEIEPERKAILNYYFNNDYIKFYKYNYKLEPIMSIKNDLDISGIGAF